MPLVRERRVLHAIKKTQTAGKVGKFSCTTLVRLQIVLVPSWYHRKVVGLSTKVCPDSSKLVAMKQIHLLGPRICGTHAHTRRVVSLTSLCHWFLLLWHTHALFILGHRLPYSFGSSHPPVSVQQFWRNVIGYKVSWTDVLNSVFKQHHESNLFRCCVNTRHDGSMGGPDYLLLQDAILSLLIGC